MTTKPITIDQCSLLSIPFVFVVIYLPAAILGCHHVIAGPSRHGTFRLFSHHDDHLYDICVD
jgi:hypothetical protein